MTKGETLGLVAVGAAVLYFMSKPSTPAMPMYAQPPLPSGGSQTAVIVGGVTSIIDSLTGALAGQGN